MKTAILSSKRVDTQNNKLHKGIAFVISDDKKGTNTAAEKYAGKDRKSKSAV